MNNDPLMIGPGHDFDDPGFAGIRNGINGILNACETAVRTGTNVIYMLTGVLHDNASFCGSVSMIH
jgi:hypothetical protein